MVAPYSSQHSSVDYGSRLLYCTVETVEETTKDYGLTHIYLLCSVSSLEQLKLLKVVIKNLVDPTKQHDPKYRQLKLDNDKVRAKLLACQSAVPLLHALGFVETTVVEEDGKVVRLLQIEQGLGVDPTVMEDALKEITSTLSQFDRDSNGEKQNNPKKPRMTSTTTTAVGPLSEKQKARRLLDEKQQKERDLAKQQRKQNVALLKQDKYVRQNDENWESGVSAACAKSGGSISTFRDKYGE